MAIKSYFYNAIFDGEEYDRVYNAEDVTSYLDKIVGSGVFPVPSNQLQVRASSGMQIIVNEGQGWIHGHKMINDADLILSVDAADVLLNRIDRVVFYTDSIERSMGIEIIKGTNAVNPVAPALVRTSSRYEMSLATISIRKGITAITGSMISDTRPDSNACGWVQGLIQQADTSTLFEQWETAYAEFMERMIAWQNNAKDAFDDWYATLTDELQVGAYMKPFSKVVNGGNNVSNIVPLDMEGYTYSVSDIIQANLNGLSLVEGYDYTLDTSTTPVRMTVNASLTTNNRLEILVLQNTVGTPTELDGDDHLYSSSST